MPKVPSISYLQELFPRLRSPTQGSSLPVLSVDLQLVVLDTLGIVAAAALPRCQGHGWSDSDIERVQKSVHYSLCTRVRQVPAPVQVP